MKTIKPNDLKVFEPIIKKGRVYDLNRGLFLDLLRMVNEIDYKYLPLNVNRTIGFNLGYGIESEIGFDKDVYKMTPKETIKAILKNFEPSKYLFKSTVFNLKQLIALCNLHYKIYQNRKLTEQLNYKLF